jgi:hypothetical protein
MILSKKIIIGTNKKYKSYIVMNDLYNFFEKNPQYTPLKLELLNTLIPEINTLDALTQDQVNLIEEYAKIILNNNYEYDNNNNFKNKIYLYKLLIMVIIRWKINDYKYSYYRSIGITDLIKKFNYRYNMSAEEYYKTIKNEDIKDLIIYLKKYYNGYLKIDNLK